VRYDTTEKNGRNGKSFDHANAKSGKIGNAVRRKSSIRQKRQVSHNALLCRQTEKAAETATPCSAADGYGRMPPSRRARD